MVSYHRSNYDLTWGGGVPRGRLNRPLTSPVVAQKSAPHWNTVHRLSQPERGRVAVHGNRQRAEHQGLRAGDSRSVCVADDIGAGSFKVSCHEPQLEPLIARRTVLGAAAIP